MTFAEAYRYEITFVYYCLNVLLTLATFLVGTIYLRRIDRRDQQWRKFAETIRGQYSTLKEKQVLSLVSETSKTFENVLICQGITESTGRPMWSLINDSIARFFVHDN